ncbi:hypothetical protein [Rhizobium tubonense]|uniref:Uncharacterized protein n=1 Tax=Rhizobium tubonense TaxID=484088 RepID=A0A2W4CUP1_9HYPH|nr:hypothetical protein [Rhizobium tubonense]PZM16407.1 hypothetical protein CPY51_03405 [Rhizobium tubonense]
MKNALIACAVGLAGLLSTSVPMQAQSLTITTDDGQSYHHPRYHRDDDYRPAHRRWDTDYQEQDRPYRHHAGCFVKTVEQHHDGMTVVKKTRVCR